MLRRRCHHRVQVGSMAWWICNVISRDGGEEYEMLSRNEAEVRAKRAKVHYQGGM